MIRKGMLIKLFKNNLTYRVYCDEYSISNDQNKYIKILKDQQLLTINTKDVELVSKKTDYLYKGIFNGTIQDLIKELSEYGKVSNLKHLISLNTDNEIINGYSVYINFTKFIVRVKNNSSYDVQLED
jgi:hypothetical protein